MYSNASEHYPAIRFYGVTNLSSSERHRLDTALHETAQAAGIDPTGAELLRYTMNAVYRLPAEHIVLRIAPAARVEVVRRVAQIGARLAELDLPTVRLAPGQQKAIETPHWAATAWTYLPQPPGHRHEQVELARPLRSLHNLQDLGFPLPEWDPISRAESRVEAAAAAQGKDLRYLQDWATDRVGIAYVELIDSLRSRCRELRAAVAATSWQLPFSVIHGDAHAGNLQSDARGQVVLGDLDSVSIGPPEWDLVPAAHGVERFGDPRPQYDALTAAYGFELLASPTWPTLRGIRELQLVTSVIAGLTGRPDVADELAHRLRSLISHDTTYWHRYR